jgi:protein-tyrosine phosphatase
MVDQAESHESMKKIFAAALKGDGKAMIWHCSGGKDRTGYVSALFLSVLGVPDEGIVNEYMLTEVYRRDFDIKEMQDMGKAFNNHPEAMKGFRAIQQSKAEYIMAGLNKIRADYGTVENYLEKEVGITAKDITKLKALYTE